MSYSPSKEKIELYSKSLGHAWGFVDYNDWPIKLNSVFHLFLNEFSEELLGDLNYLENVKMIPLHEIAASFYNPARIYRMIDTTIFGMRRRKFTLEEQRIVVLKMLSMVKMMKYGSEFNENGQNIIYTPEQEKEISANGLLQRECTLEESQIVHRLCGVLWAYTEAIFFRAHDVTKEIHGPYTSYANSNLLVKEYLNLNAKEIWPDISLLPYSKIKIYQNYNDSMKMSIDALNHLYHKEGNFVQSLRNYHIEVDGKSITIDELPSITDQIIKTIQQITEKVDAMSWHEKVTKYAEIFWFRKKPLRDLRGLNWRLSEKIISNILTGQENPRRVNRLSEDQVYRLALITI